MLVCTKDKEIVEGNYHKNIILLFFLHSSSLNYNGNEVENILLLKLNECEKYSLYKHTKLSSVRLDSHYIKSA